MQPNLTVLKRYLPIIKSEKQVVFFSFFILLLNLFLKALYLTSQDISLDEPFSIYHAQFDLSDLLLTLKNHNNPPLFEILLHFWIQFFGISPIAVRILPYLFACVSPVLLFYFGKRHFALNVAIAGSLLLTFSDLLMFYSHDCRAYSSFIFLSLLSMHYFLRMLEVFLKTNIFLFIICSASLIYIHYFGFIVLFIQVVFLLLFYRHQLVRFMLPYLFIFALYLPQIIFFVVRFKSSVHAGWINVPTGIEDLYNMLWIFSNFPFITVSCIIILVGALVKWLFNKNRGNLHKPSILVALWFLIPFFGMFFISFWIPMYIARYLIFALPAYYLSVILCLQYIIHDVKWQNLIIFAIVFSMLITHQLNPDKKQPIQKTVTTIKKMQTPNAIVVVCPFDFITTFAYHYNRYSFSKFKAGNEYGVLDSLLKTENVYCVNSFQEVDHNLNNKVKRVIYFFSGSEPNSKTNELKTQLDQHFQLISENKTGPCFFINEYVEKK